MKNLTIGQAPFPEPSGTDHNRFPESSHEPKTRTTTGTYTHFRSVAPGKHLSKGMSVLAQDPRVLLVDDNASVRDMLVDLVQSLGYRADPAANGEEALALFDSRRYGIVLTDLVMPGMSGWDVLAALRQRDPNMPVIIVTGSPIVGDPRASQPGVAVLKKPVDVMTLDTMIKRMLHARLAV